MVEWQFFYIWFEFQAYLNYHSKKGEHIGTIHSLDGKIVKEFNYGVLESGDHVVKWDGLDNYGVPVHSGVYFFKLTDQQISQSRKLLLVR